MKFDYGVQGDSFEVIGPSWLYDRHGVLCRPVAIKGDTETGVCVCAVFDDDGTRVMDWGKGEAVTVVRHFAAPLTVVPVPEGRDPRKPDEHQPGRPMAGLRCVVAKPDGVIADVPAVVEKKDGD